MASSWEGESLHSARKLLEIETEPRQEKALDSGSGLEKQLREMLAQMQEQTDAEVERLREVIRRAIGVLEGGLGTVGT